MCARVCFVLAVQWEFFFVFFVFFPLFFGGGEMSTANAGPVIAMRAGAGTSCVCV